MLWKSSFVLGAGGFPPSGTAGTEAQSLSSGGSLVCLSSLAASPCALGCPAQSLQGKQTMRVHHGGFLEVGLVLRLMAAQLRYGSVPDVKHLVL